MMKYIPFKIRYWIYINRVSLDVFVYVLAQSLIFKSIVIDLKPGDDNMYEFMDIMKCITASSIIPLFIFITSRLIINDYRFYPSGEWRYFNGFIISAIPSLIMISNLDITASIQLGAINTVFNMLIMLFLSLFTPIYNTKWE